MERPHGRDHWRMMGRSIVLYIIRSTTNLALCDNNDQDHGRWLHLFIHAYGNLRFPPLTAKQSRAHRNIVALVMDLDQIYTDMYSDTPIWPLLNSNSDTNTDGYKSKTDI